MLAIIACAENQKLEKIYARFATLDMLPRINMAIKLTREAKWPHHLTRPLVEIRKAIQKEGQGVGEKRNLFVHGVHKQGEHVGEYVLTMARWSPEKREQVVTALDGGQLINQLIELVQKADGVFRGYGAWKIDPKYATDSREQIAKTKAAARLIRTKNIKRAIKIIFANLKG